MAVLRSHRVTANLCSFVDMSTKLHTLEDTRNGGFSVQREKTDQICLPWQLHGRFSVQQHFANQQNFHIEQFNGHSENAKKIDFMPFSK